MEKKVMSKRSIALWITAAAVCLLLLLAALFVPKSSNLPLEVNFTATAGEGGTVEVVRGKKEKYHVGDEVTVEAKASEHYRFAGWVDLLNETPNEIISIESTYTFVLERSVEINAIFYMKTQFPIYAHIPTELGEMILDYGSKEGDDYNWLHLDPIERENWTFEGWFLDAEYTKELNAENYEAYINADPAPTEVHIYAKMTRDTATVNFTFYVVNGEKEVATDVTNPNVGPFYAGTVLELLPATKASEEVYAYHFDKYYTDEELTIEYTPVVLTKGAVINVYGKFTRQNITTHTVTWKVEGVTVETDTAVLYNDHPSYDGATPTKEGTAQFTYTFKGWAVENTEVVVDLAEYVVTADVVFVALFDETTKQYEIKFVNSDGTEIEKQTLDYGAMPVAPATNPTHPTAQAYPGKVDTYYNDAKVYTFKGYTPEITAVNAAATYTAVYEERALESYNYALIAKGDVLNGMTIVKGKALELHETITPTKITIGGKDFDSAYYMDDSLTTEATVDTIRAGLNKETTLNIYVKLTAFVAPTVANSLAEINTALGIELTAEQLPEPAIEGLKTIEVMKPEAARAALVPSDKEYVTLKVGYDTIEHAENAYIMYDVADVENVAFITTDYVEQTAYFTIKIAKAVEETVSETKTAVLTFGQNRDSNTQGSLTQDKLVNDTGLSIGVDASSKVYYTAGNSLKLGSGTAEANAIYVTFTFDANISISFVTISASTNKESDKVEMTVNGLYDNKLVTNIWDDHQYDLTEASNVITIGTKTPKKAFYLDTITFTYTLNA